MEQQILELLKLGWSVRRIREQLGCTEYRINLVRAANGFVRDPDAPLRERALRNRGDYPASLLNEWDSVTTKLRRYFK